MWHIGIVFFYVSNQAQVLTMAGQTKDAEKMTRGIISRGSRCIECYRLLSSIYSKHGNHTEVCTVKCYNCSALA